VKDRPVSGYTSFEAWIAQPHITNFVRPLFFEFAELCRLIKRELTLDHFLFDENSSITRLINIITGAMIPK
ncbi:MAG TPA: hypothetical protein PKJ84_13535, partial [Anaerolineales bacterium]|nr:hypothetical protein [Anaerolineales bacterium]